MDNNITKLQNLTKSGCRPRTSPGLVLFVLFKSQLQVGIAQNLTINGKSVDGVLGIQTQDHRMIGADKSAELWRPPFILNVDRGIFVH